MQGLTVTIPAYMLPKGWQDWEPVAGSRCVKAGQHYLRWNGKRYEIRQVPANVKAYRPSQPVVIVRRKVREFVWNEDNFCWGNGSYYIATTTRGSFRCFKDNGVVAPKDFATFAEAVEAARKDASR